MNKSPGVEIAESREYYGFVYMWCDTEREKYYIGSHKGSLFDRYVCSSTWCKRAYRSRPSTFKRHILAIVHKPEDLHPTEEYWLKLYNVQDNPNFYNHKNTARGGSGKPKWAGGSKKAYLGDKFRDSRKGKTVDQIYKDPEYAKIVRNRLSVLHKKFIDEHGHGMRKGKKCTKPSWRIGKSVYDLYGYYRVPNPRKPFNIFVTEPCGKQYTIECQHEQDFFEKMQMETYTLNQLKKHKQKLICKLQSNTKHNLPKGTLLKLEYI